MDSTIPRIFPYDNDETSDFVEVTIADCRMLTALAVQRTVKSHVSHIVADSGWEHSIAFQLEKSNDVVAYVKNDKLDFTISYEFEGATHNYIPDYIIRLRLLDSSELNVILEVKGFESEQDRAKKAAARRWVDAVNHHGGFGRWTLAECRSLHVAESP